MLRWLNPFSRRPPEAVPASQSGADLGAPQAGGSWAPTQDAERLKAEADRLFDANRLPEALSAYRHLLEAHPGYGRAWNNFGLCLRVTGRLSDAQDAFERAVATTPDLVPAWVNLASAQEEQGRPTAALDSLRRALDIDPFSREAMNNAAQLLATLGRYCAAEAEFRRALARHPDDPGLHFNLGLALVRQARIDDALAELQVAADLEPGSPAVASAYLMALNYSDTRDPMQVREAHDRLVRRWVGQDSGPASSHRLRSGPLRVGYVSADFGHHVVSFFIEPVLAAHDRARVETYCYYTGLREDEQCGRIKSLGVRWRHVAPLDEAAILQLVREDDLDIAVDLSGHTEGHLLRLFSQRLAPVQVSWLGYPNTTAVPAIDYRLTDGVADPPGTTEQFHSESLYRLEHGFLVYRPRLEAPEVGELPALSRGAVTFASFNNFAKVSGTSLALWADILSRIPDARLLLKSKGLDEPELAIDVRRRFAAAGGDPARLILEGQQPGFGQHLARYGVVDIALDTYPYCGTTTTCEALWMGVPVVTLAGRVHAARVGASLLAQVGHPEWVAPSADRYVDIAVSMAADLDALRRTRHALREAMRTGALTDARAFAGHLESAFETMVAARRP